jgi:hypothetical protein
LKVSYLKIICNESGESSLQGKNVPKINGIFTSTLHNKVSPWYQRLGRDVIVIKVSYVSAI